MKIWNYVVISIFLALLFEMAGIPIASSLLERVGIDVAEGTAGFKGAEFWRGILVLLGGAVAGGLVIGFLTRASSENYVILVFIAAEVVLFTAPLLEIISVAQGYGGWIFYITLLITAPLIVGFGIAIYEHFRGTD